MGLALTRIGVGDERRPDHADRPLGRVEPGRVDALKGAVTQRLEEHRDARGYQFDKPIRFTLASRSTP